MEMPPLPEPDGAAAIVTDTIRLYNGLNGDVEEYVDAWSEPLVRAYAESCARMAREEAAKEWEADALRYRWLREESELVASVVGGGIAITTGPKHPKDMRQLDERIDPLPATLAGSLRREVGV